MKVHWIGLGIPGRLGVSRRPDGGALDEQFARRGHGVVDHVVNLLEPEAAASTGLAGEGAACEPHGVGFCNFPITDDGLPPNVEHYHRVAHAIDRRLPAGQARVMHCRAGLDRAPSLANGALIASGMNIDGAVLRVGRACGRPAAETDEQYEFHKAFAAGEM
ncbi:hypothetical protein GCM10009116_21460 [Brevundimonas basaltis]|uniref:Protein-tyrosine phosphatase n=1 Tax=Brevundimonas basaltis TaxID=472166 RepID=A0A7W8HZK8_9CAUL|nr:tyrosine protein phosphatase [Brevundimonas basaltis]MBB5291895.1 protein-tyrosine phosphatase [Brevundimonas basaltis]